MRPINKQINTILLALRNESAVGGVICDLAKSLNCVNHNILLSKPEFSGIADKFNTLI
jgi:hypothetical protein